MTIAEPALYQIRVQGRLDPSWSDRLAGMMIETDQSASSPVTTLTGELIDQSALHGVFNTLLELHLPILSAQCLTGPERTSDAEADPSACLRGRRGHGRRRSRHLEQARRES
ncbi:MAG: hypothetical protein GY719_20315 [bacterium]|nr:hypothetical protein [bacterium]